MQRTLKDIFAEEMLATPIDENLCKRIIKFDKNFVNKNEIHIEFFGSPLLGVHPMRFLESDRDMWFEEVLEIDEILLKKEFHSCKSINTTHVVASDTFNFSCLALINRILEEETLNEKIKEQVCISIIAIFHYKTLGSILSHFFKYPADKGTAIATYNQLSKKFEIKHYGSWGKFIRARAEELLKHNNIFYKRVKVFEDEDYIRSVNNLHNGIKSTIKSMNDVFYQVRENKTKYLASSAMGMDMEGKEFVKDLSRKYPDYRAYIHSVISDKSSFMKKELVEIVSNVIPSMSADFLVDALKFMMNNYSYRGNKVVENILDETLFFTFEYIERNKNETFNINNLGDLIVKLKNVYSSSRNTDETLIKLRKDVEDMVSDAIRSRNPTVIASVRTGIMLYIVLRAFTRNYFTS